jgi:hypothetical protein
VHPSQNLAFRYFLSSGIGLPPTAPSTPRTLDQRIKPAKPT